MHSYDDDTEQDERINEAELSINISRTSTSYSTSTKLQDIAVYLFWLKTGLSQEIISIIFEMQRKLYSGHKKTPNKAVCNLRVKWIYCRCLFTISGRR